jgi:hypothetical protein
VSERRDRFDPELSELLSDDPELLEMSQMVRESRPDPVLDPRFEAVLRARLMHEAQTVLKPRRERWRVPNAGRRLWGGVGFGAALASVAVVAVVAGHLLTQSPAYVAVSTPVAGLGQVDPKQAITLSFNQPMNEQSVSQALKIEPATAFTVSWTNPETAVVKPDHPLAANTDYQVTVAKSTAQSQSGQMLRTDETFTFGTQPGPSAIPILQSTIDGEASGAAQVFWDAGGNPGVTASTAWQRAATAAPSAVASPSSSATAKSTATPSATASASASASASPSAAAASPSSNATATSPVPLPEVVSFPDGGTPLILSQSAATAVAFSTGPGHNLALAIPETDGGSVIEIADADGSAPYVIWPAGGTPGVPVTALAWSGDNTIVFVVPTGIEAVDVTSLETTLLDAFPARTGTAVGVVLAPDGGYAYVPAADIPVPASASASPTAAATATAAAIPTAMPTPSPVREDGSLIDLSSAVSTPTALPGSAGGVVTFSGDSSLVAWVSGGGAGATQSVLEVPTASPAATPTVIPGPPTEPISGLALSNDGSEIAYGLGLAGLQVGTTSDGTVLGTSPDVLNSMAFSPDTSRLAYVAGGSLKVAAIAPSIAPTVTECPGAEQVLSQFVTAQVVADDATLASLSVPGLDASTETPAGLSRGYVISVGCDTSGDALTASARLIVDASAGAVGELTDETITLLQKSTGWQVTQLTVPPLRPEGAGPKVLQVEVTPPDSSASSPETMVAVTFDSDLQPGSVTANSIVLEARDGQILQQVGPPTYNGDTRTVTLSVAGALPAGAVMVVERSVTDIDGGQLAAAFTAPVGG